MRALSKTLAAVLLCGAASLAQGLVVQTVAFFGHGGLAVRSIRRGVISTSNHKNRPLNIAYRYEQFIL